MKVRLERAGEWLELVRHGRTVFVQRSSGEEEAKSFFDDAAAESGLRGLLEAHAGEGWVESAQTRRQREQQEQVRVAAAARLEQAIALSKAADPRAALRELDAERFAPVLGLVVAIDDPSEGGFRVRLQGGGAIVCGTANDALWFYSDAESDDHDVYFGADAGPPEGDCELDGTRFEGAEVNWFLEEAHRRHWFTTREEPNVAHAWEYDGGLSESATARTPSQVLASVLKDRLGQG